MPHPAHIHVAWECLAGECPFQGESPLSTLFQVVNEPPPSLLPKVLGLSPKVEDVLLRALSKKKANRSAGEEGSAVLAALRAAVWTFTKVQGVEPTNNFARVRQIFSRLTRLFWGRRRATFVPRSTATISPRPVSGAQKEPGGRANASASICSRSR